MKDKVKLTRSMLKEKIEEFVDEEIMDEKAENTYNKYEIVVRNFVDFFKDEEIQKKDLIRYKKMLIERYRTKTVNNYLIIVNKFIKYVELTETGEYSKERLKKHISSYALKPVKEQEKTSIENVLNPSEYKRMLRVAKVKDEEIYHIMKIFGYSGIRAGELKYFTVENVSSSKNYIEVFNKGKKRKVPLRGDLKRSLLRYAKKRGIEEGTLFPGRNGNMICKKTVENRIKKICGMCRGIKIEKAHPHSFRHMFAIQWVSQNGQASLSELAKILGHSNINTTAIYTNTTQQEKKKKVEKIKY